MALYTDPQTCAANPPRTWEVVKGGDRSWRLVDASGAVLVRKDTRKAAIEEARTGPFVRMWLQERRWYAGERVDRWKPYAGTPLPMTADDPCPIQRDGDHVWREFDPVCRYCGTDMTPAMTEPPAWLVAMRARRAEAVQA